MSDQEGISFDRRRALLTVGVAAALALGAVAVVGNFANYHKLVHAAVRADKLWVPLCFAGEVVAYGGYIVAYRGVARARGGPVFDWWTAGRIVGLGFGAYVIGAAVGGLAVDYWALHRAGEKPHAAARRVLGLNTLEWVVLGCYAWVAAVALLAGAGKGAPFAMTVAWIVVIPACVGGALYVSAAARVDRLAALPDGGSDSRERGRDPRAWAKWAWLALKKAFADAIGGVAFVRYLLAHPVRYFQAVLGFALYWCGDILCLYAAVRAFGPRVGPAAIVLGYATGYIVTSAPLPAGAAGASEASTALALHLVGVPLSAAVLAAFVYRIFTFWLPIAPALALVPALRALNEELPRSSRDCAAHVIAPAR